MSKANPRILAAVLALCAAAGVYWLSSEFRPSGVLGALQVALQPLVFLPYIAGAVFGGTAHSPSAVAFAAALFIQFFVVFWLLLVIWRRKHAR